MSHAHSVALTCCLLACLCYQCSCLPAQFIPLSLLTFHAYLCCFPISVASCSKASITQSDSSACHQHMDFTLQRILHSFCSEIRFFIFKEEQLCKDVCWCVAGQEYTGLSVTACVTWTRMKTISRETDLNGFYSGLLLFSLTLVKSLAIETVLPNHLIYIAPVFSRLLATLFLLRVCLLKYLLYFEAVKQLVNKVLMQ